MANRSTFSIFFWSITISVAGLALAYHWGGLRAVLITAILCVMEITLSFDNAVVNATILKDMSEKWQKRFLTWGILIAVVGMRLIFPIAIVAIVADMHFTDVINIALNKPNEYQQALTSAHINISAFGGMFLLMVFLHFVFNEHKDIHWINIIEEKLSKLGKMDAIEMAMAMLILLGVVSNIPADLRLPAMYAGITGILLYVFIHGATEFMSDSNKKTGEKVLRNGFWSFVYLEFLDASFSLDGVVGAFAITKDIVLIMIGLGVGAIFVRSITIFLVYRGTLQKYVYLEHGAHYAVGALSTIMLLSMHPSIHIPEVITGLIGMLCIGLAFVSSLNQSK